MRASFVIPSFNSAAWLVHAVKSAQKQSIGDVEIVVVDDASTDSTEQIMRFMSEDRRINYIKLEKNVGRSEARNIGSRAAKSDIIMVLDADDIAYQNRAELSIKALKKADFVHGSADVIDAIGTKLGTHQADVFNKDRAVKEGVNRIVHSTCAYRKEVALKFPYRAGEASRLGVDDWQFQLEVAFSGAALEHITPVVGAYRDIETGVSKTRNHDEVMKFKKQFTEGLLAKV